MTDSTWTITQEDVDFALEPDSDVYDVLLAHLLINDVILLGCRWHKSEDKNLIAISVICSDTFAYACADCEALPCDEIPTLYRMWRADDMYGPVAWCMKQRKAMPINPHADKMRARGWDLEKLAAGEVIVPVRRVTL